MSQRFYSYLSGWEWHILQHTTPQNMIKIFPDAADWILHLDDNSNHGILISNQNTNNVIVQGMLNVQLSEDKDDIHPLHFWMSKTKLITIHKDNRIPIRLQNLNYTALYEQCETAPEAFCVMINVLLEYFHISLDYLQTLLGQLEIKVSAHNRKDLLDDIIDRRYELLHFSHLYLPYREFEGIIIEAFQDELVDKKSFVRLQHRFDRINTLLKHYAVEIDTLLSVDDAISSMRGNEIIRTLTIFTVLCLPATILGSIWGSNFEWLPFKNEPFGFIYLILTIFVITGFLSFLLWKKGWTGNIIVASKKNSRRRNKLKQALFAEMKEETEEDAEVVLPPRKERKARFQVTQTIESKRQAEQVLEELPKRSKRRKK